MKTTFTRALIIDSPWIDYILDGSKTWEMRTRATKLRGRIGLIRKGSGLIVGEVTLVDSLPAQPREQLLATTSYHRMAPADIRSGAVARWRCPWVLKDVKRYIKPIPYEHPQGAVIWVDLSKALP